MSHVPVDVGFVPLVDAAPLVVAREIGFAAEEGLELTLHREASWATQRDRLVWGQYQAAHMVAPMVVALSAGIGGLKAELDALSVLSVNGSMIGVRPEMADRMGAADLGFTDAAAVGEALARTARGRLRIGVPFPYSMHALLLGYWLNGPGQPLAHQLVVVPPPQMADAVASGDIDIFCVGEPWGSVAVWRAAKWISERGNIGVATELLALDRYLGVPAEILERVLSGRIVVNGHGRVERVRRSVEFFDAAATFPWRSQALWIAEALARETGLPAGPLRDVARSCFRSDIYRAAVGPIGADLPGASEKLEGALQHRTEVASTLGRLILGPDSFCDGRVFDPEDLAPVAGPAQ